MYIPKIYRQCVPAPLRQLNRRLFQAAKFVITGYNGLIKRSSPSLAYLIGMTTLDEQKFYEKCVQKVSLLDGAVVDLGCWMGSTTIPLVKSLNQTIENSSTVISKVYAFDRFVWESWMDVFMPKLSCKYIPGESFLPEARGLMNEFKDQVELIQCDLTNYLWQTGSIKLLLIDAMKNDELARRITQNFFSHLVVGALVIHQDFKHFFTPWIHILMYRLSGYLPFYYEVEKGCTVAFRMVENIPSKVIEEVTLNLCNGVNNDEVSQAFEYSMNLVSEEGKPSIAAAHVAHYAHSDEKEFASELLAKYMKVYKNANYDLTEVGKMLNE